LHLAISAKPSYASPYRHLGVVVLDAVPPPGDELSFHPATRRHDEDEEERADEGDPRAAAA
jgi:hypothetical protein